ncbi:hypothetical protein [Tenacibaculum aiptasiae]|uniref:hypothetical protein n=1 Tax=Tenacibaculum aiptasiae TaxID=426481 RepID=UPI00232C5231|nr:hypothetical protein [Tenacibaculum aiptasiae]
MTKSTLFQTLEDRENPEYVEDNGPFSCNWPNTWLGSGYYFWDTFIKNAHWWGDVRYKGRHIICRTECSYDENTCFDLAGNTSHLSVFSEILKVMEDEGLLDKKINTVSRVINYLRDVTDFHYEAIRAHGINSISQNKEEYLKTLNFEVGKHQYLDYQPPFQFCIFKAKGLNLKKYEIVHPPEYIEVLG